MFYAIPLGLGLKTPKPPYISIILTLSMVSAYIYFGNPSLDKNYKEIAKKHHLHKISLKGMSEFCQTKNAKSHKALCKSINNLNKKNKGVSTRKSLNLDLEIYRIINSNPRAKIILDNPKSCSPLR